MPKNKYNESEYNKYMQIAINMAKRGIGNTAPNPSVGCVIEKDGIIIARGWTRIGGVPHAETNAIEFAYLYSISSTKNANLYVTLEPCSHYGKTPPCVKAIFEADIKKVIIATQDPNPEVSGKGIEFLRNNGIEVVEGVCRKEANEINAGFFKTIIEKRPYITLKLALTSDGKLSTAKRGGEWFTNDIAKSYAHMLRYKNDAILVGSGTLLDDNPSLTCRLNGLEKYSPKRFVLSNSLKEINEEYNCYQAKIVNGDIKDIVHKLAVDYGITKLLIEGGGKTALSFLQKNIVDEIHLITAENINGNPEAKNFRKKIKGFLKKYILSEERYIGDNKLTVYKKY